MIRRRAYIRRRTPLPPPTAPIRRTKPLRSRVVTPARAQAARAPSRPKCGAWPPPHRKLVEAADRLWRFLIYMKEPEGVCPRCGARWWHDAAHGWAKGPYPGLRFEIDNGLPLCRACHTRVDSDHQAKEELWRRSIGHEAYDRLALRSQAHCKTDVQLTIIYLTQEYDRRGLPLPKGGEGAHAYRERCAGGGKGAEPSRS